MMEVMVTTTAIRQAKLHAKRHHRQTNTHLFTGRMLLLSPNQQCQSTKGYYPPLNPPNLLLCPNNKE